MSKSIKFDHISNLIQQNNSYNNQYQHLIEQRS